MRLPAPRAPPAAAAQFVAPAAAFALSTLLTFSTVGPLPVEPALADGDVCRRDSIPDALEAEWCAR